MSVVLERKTRPRRLRHTPAVRALVRETHLRPNDMIMPLFVVEGVDVTREIASMPGQFHHSVDRLDSIVDRLLEVGVGNVILFGIPESKDPEGRVSLDDDGIIQRAVRHLRGRYRELHITTDVCLCEYTDHGHCGVLRDGTVDNDPTLEILARQAVSHALAGADMVAPSGMMDGMVAAIRGALDSAGYSGTPIMSYSAKYASAYYGPFREAAQSTPQTGDRRGYQMDPSNRREAFREVQLDIEEGADIVMVKPALAYLDIIRDVRERVDVPVACFNVSGEYAMIKAAARAGFIDEDAVMMESLIGMKRAGADIILTYFAERAARFLAHSKLIVIPD
ncbi:MAG TPA: porphobilinogen synthase [Rhodothermales bacterium]|nr:porphobilinogen synthase [Rhodothermales bacterium]